MTRFHPESPDLAPGDLAKLRFMAELRNQLQNRLSRGNRALYDTKLARPEDEDLDPDHAPGRREELKAEMEREPYFLAWSSMMRSSQDLTWRLVGQAVERDLPRIQAKLGSREAGRGSLELDDGVEPPAYLLAADTHRMPGSYFRQDGPSDVRAGALYDLGSAMYQFGRGDQSGRLLNDARGRTTVAHLRRYYADLAPVRILDMGCSVGANVLPLCDAYPAARVEAIDIGAPMLRYGHVRARGLNRSVHFSQRDAEATGLPDHSFDLVTSQILLHETSPEASVNILRESFRLLRPGGVAIHLEVPIRLDRLDVCDQFLRTWEQYYNGEANTLGIAGTDLEGEMQRVGFQDVLAGFQAVATPGDTEPAGLCEAPPSQRSLFIVSGRRP